MYNKIMLKVRTRINREREMVVTECFFLFIPFPYDDNRSETTMECVSRVLFSCFSSLWSMFIYFIIKCAFKLTFFSIANWFLLHDRETHSSFASPSTSTIFWTPRNASIFPFHIKIIDWLFEFEHGKWSWNFVRCVRAFQQKKLDFWSLFTYL